MADLVTALRDFNKDRKFNRKGPHRSRKMEQNSPAVGAPVEPSVRPHGECHNGHKFKMQCPNMKEREGDTSMSYEHYDCKVCGAHVALDYEEMR